MIITPWLERARKALSKSKLVCKKWCYECCTRIEFSQEELERIQESMKKKWIESSPKGKWTFFCEYLDHKWKCVVYEERPLVCRAIWNFNINTLTCYHNKELNELNPKVLPKEFLDYIRVNINSMVKNDSRSDKLTEESIETIIDAWVHTIIMYTDWLLNTLRNSNVKITNSINNNIANKLEELEKGMNKHNDSLKNYFWDVLTFKDKY